MSPTWDFGRCLLGLSSCALLVLACAAPEAGDEACHALAGDLVITELLPDPSGVDTGKEYIELFNATATNLQLEGLTLFHAAADGSAEKKLRLAAASIPAGDYFVLGDARAEPPAHVDYSYGKALGGLRNDAGKVGVRCGQNLVDEVSYQDVKAGHARQLDGRLVPDSVSNDDPSRWCDASQPIGGSVPDFGTPQARNSPCASANAASCEDPDTGEPRPVVPPEAGALIISEVMADPALTSDADGEWFELFAKADLDLNGLGVRSGNSTTTLASTVCLHLSAGSFAVVARSETSSNNGGLPAVTALSQLSLANAAASLSIENGEGPLDEVSWTSTKPGVSLQLSADVFEAAPDERGRAWCAASAPYGKGDKGTPGAANDMCPRVAALGECEDAETGRLRSIEKPEPGQLSITEILAHSARVPDSDGEWLEVFASAPADLNGLEIDCGGKREVLAAAQCLRLEAGSHSVLAHDADASVNGGLPAVIATFRFGLPNTGLRSIVLRSEGVVIDRATYSGATAGVSVQRPSPSLDGAAPSFCATPEGYSYGLGDRGTPGAANPPCAANPSDDDACIDLDTGVARPTLSPTESQLVISEVMANPAAVSDGDGEWLEIFARSDLDLNGVTLRSGSSAATLTSASCLHVAAGTYAVVARSEQPDRNGGLPPVVATTTATLANGASFLSLENGAGVLDEVAWPATKAGKAWQLAASALEAPREQRRNAYCFASQTYGSGDRGTPGAANDPCTDAPGGSVTPPQCVDPSDGRLRDLVTPSAGQLVITELMSAPTIGNAGAGEWFEVLATADVDLNGVTLANEGAGATLLSSETCLRASAGQLLLFARSDDPAQNGGLPAPAARFAFGLADAASTAAPERAVVLRFSGTELDRASWTSSSRGVSRQRSFDASAPASDAAWCLTPPGVTFGTGQRGTPGAENRPCP